MNKAEDLPSEQRKDLARIQRSQRHLLSLINGVLNFAKLDAGVIRYEIGDVAMTEVLATCEALVKPQLRAKRIVFRSPDTRTTLRAKADLDKVQQIVLNMMSNAIKFTNPEGRVTLTCSGSDGRVIVQVSDTGRGIAADQLERVFEPFVQVDATLTRTEEGTGLGLAISRELARGMGGELIAESTVGEGSTFTLSLPAL